MAYAETAHIEGDSNMAELNHRELVELIDKAIMKFHGNSEELENAIGALMLGRKTRLASAVPDS